MALTYMSILISIYPSYRPFIHYSINPPAHPINSPFIHTLFHPFIHPSFIPSVCPSVRPSVRQSVISPIPPLFHLYIHRSTHASIRYNTNNNSLLFRHRQIRDCCPVHRCLQMIPSKLTLPSFVPSVTDNLNFPSVR